MRHKKKRSKTSIHDERLRNLKKARAARRNGSRKRKTTRKGTRICFCPASISWIIKHLNKSAKKTFRKMIGR